jgi:hypothetical protein
MITINLNTIFEVELTKVGREIYVNHLNDYAKNSSEYKKYYDAKIAELYNNPHIQLELWHLMNIFGPHMYNGCDIPFKNNILTKN